MQIWATALQSLLGSPGNPVFLARVVSVTDSALASATAYGALVGDANDPAYSNISASISGDVTTVNATIQPPVPTNFIEINATATSYQGTVTVSVTSPSVTG